MKILVSMYHDWALACFFFFNDTPPTEIYTLSLHDALPISAPRLGDASSPWFKAFVDAVMGLSSRLTGEDLDEQRSEEHTSELQSRENLVCRLLLEKKKRTEKCRIPPTPLPR